VAFAEDDGLGFFMGDHDGGIGKDLPLGCGRMIVVIDQIFDRLGEAPGKLALVARGVGIDGVGMMMLAA
jgi:hypothetical protein